MARLSGMERNVKAVRATGAWVAYAFDGGTLFRRAIRTILPDRTGAWPLARARLRRRPWLTAAMAPCSEIDCVRHLLPRPLIARAEQRALQLGLGADEVLIADGVLDERRYAKALATSLAVPFEPLEWHLRQPCALAPESLLLAPQAGLLALRSSTGPLWVIAPRGVPIRSVIKLLCEQPDLRRRICVTTPSAIDRFVRQHAAAALADWSSEQLKTAQPAFSAAHRSCPKISLSLLAAAVAIILVTPWDVLRTMMQAVVGLVFLLWSAFRIWTALGSNPPQQLRRPPCESQLPTYTVIVALYREAACVPDLIQALNELDYPALGSRCTKCCRRLHNPALSLLAYD